MLISLPDAIVKDRPILYYNKFKYRLTFRLLGAGLTEYRRKIDEYKANIADRIYQNSRAINQGREPAWPGAENINFTTIEQFLIFREKYHSRRQPTDLAGIYASGDSVRIFSNDLSILDEAVKLNCQDYVLTKINVVLDTPGIMLFSREPKFKYRTYFKPKRVTADWKTEFKTFLKNHTEIVPCGAILQFLNTPVQRYYGLYLGQSMFVEYNNSSSVMLMSLFFDSKYIDKHYELKKR